MAFLAVATIAMVGCKENPDNPGNNETPGTTVKTPTATDLAGYIEDGKYVVCVYFEEQICNDVVFAGSYNGWITDPADETMLRFEALDGFEGWYVVAVPSLTQTADDGTESLYNEGKPVQLASDGSFSWDYQTGDAESWTVLAGTVNIEAGYAGESNLNGYDPAGGPVILKSAYFKNHNSPCVASEALEYTVILFAPDCGGFEPAIIGDFNGWAEGVAMDLQADGSYKYVFSDTKGHGFKFKATTDTDWTNQIQHFALNEETGAEEWGDLGNEILGDETTITLQYNAAEYKWTLCD